MKTIQQTVLLNANADEVYEMLINPRKLSKITGGKATNSMKEGGKFSAYDDYIKGTNVKLVPGKKIVQNWACDDFPKGQDSLVTIDLVKKGEKQTELVFKHENVPDELFEDLSLGWNEFYWEPMKDHLEDLMWK